MPAIQYVERRGAIYYWRRTICLPDGNSAALRLSLKTSVQSVARRIPSALTTRSELLMMTLGQTGQSSALTTRQKSTIFRRALEEMRDALDRSHAQFQREQPDPAYMIEGMVSMLEVMLCDHVSYGLPSDAGSRRHVEARLPALTPLHRETLIGFSVDKPDWRDRSVAAAAIELERLDAAIDDDNVSIA